MLRSVTRLIVLFAALISTACSSTTMIRSSDPQAKIYVDGELRGRGSVTHTDTKTIGGVTTVRMQKDGCEPQSYAFSRNEEFDVGACIGGVLVLVPFLWIQKYKPEHSYEYECVPTKSARTASAEADDEAPAPKRRK